MSNLNPAQFPAMEGEGVTYHYAADTGLNKHVVTAMSGDAQVGEMIWHPWKGHVVGITVDPAHRRQGIASGMWSAARAYSDLSKGEITEPQHSSQRTQAGDAWAKSVSPAESVPPHFKDVMRLRPGKSRPAFEERS